MLTSMTIINRHRLPHSEARPSFSNTVRHSRVDRVGQLYYIALVSYSACIVKIPYI